MASIIDTYLHDLQQSLQVGPHQKARILCEVKDHLLEGTQHEQEHGLALEEAQHRVIERFGPVHTVALQFATDLAVGSIRRATRAMLLAELGIVAWFTIRARFQPRGPWPHDILPDYLAVSINTASFAFLVALLISLFAFWRVHRYRWGANMPRRAIQFTVVATTLAFAALLVDGIASSIFTFQRTAAVVGSPSTLVQVCFVGIEMLLILAGGIFVMQAAIRSTALHMQSATTGGK